MGTGKREGIGTGMMKRLSGSRRIEAVWTAGLLVLPMLLAATGCREGSSGHAAGTISIDGSSTVYPVTEAVAEEFGAEHPEIRVTVGFSGTGGGMKKFIAGDIDMCDASRPMKESEVQACEQQGVDYIRLEVAFDGLAVVVNPKNDWCDSMTVEQLRELWRPESAVRQWKDLNADWPAEDIVLYGPGTDSGTFDSFTKAIVGEEGASRADYTASEDDNVLVTGVQEDRCALGYFGYAYYAENRDRLKLVAVDNGSGPVAPSEETVRNGTYAPLSRPLYLYVRRPALSRPEVRMFLEFYLDNVAALCQEVGYVPVSDQVAQENRRILEEAAAGS